MDGDAYGSAFADFFVTSPLTVAWIEREIEDDPSFWCWRGTEQTVRPRIPCVRVRVGTSVGTITLSLPWYPDMQMSTFREIVSSLVGVPLNCLRLTRLCRLLPAEGTMRQARVRSGDVLVAGCDLQRLLLSLQ